MERPPSGTLEAFRIERGANVYMYATLRFRHEGTAVMNPPCDGTSGLQLTISERVIIVRASFHAIQVASDNSTTLGFPFARAQGGLADAPHQSV